MPLNKELPIYDWVFPDSCTFYSEKSRNFDDTQYCASVLIIIITKRMIVQYLRRNINVWPMVFLFPEFMEEIKQFEHRKKF